MDEQLATESHQLREQMIHKIRTALEVPINGAETVTTTQCREFQVSLNRSQQEATKWSNNDQQRANECLKHQILKVTLVKCQLIHQLFQYHQ